MNKTLVLIVLASIPTLSNAAHSAASYKRNRTRRFLHNTKFHPSNTNQTAATNNTPKPAATPEQIKAAHDFLYAHAALANTKFAKTQNPS
jgi:hypothetical protein